MPITFIALDELSVLDFEIVSFLEKAPPPITLENLYAALAPLAADTTLYRALLGLRHSGVIALDSKTCELELLATPLWETVHQERSLNLEGLSPVEYLLVEFIRQRQGEPLIQNDIPLLLPVRVSPKTVDRALKRLLNLEIISVVGTGVGKARRKFYFNGDGARPVATSLTARLSSEPSSARLVRRASTNAAPAEPGTPRAAAQGGPSRRRAKRVIDQAEVIRLTLQHMNGVLSARLLDQQLKGLSPGMAELNHLVEQLQQSEQIVHDGQRYRVRQKYGVGYVLVAVGSQASAS